MIKDAMEKNEKAMPNGADLEVLKKHFGMCFNSDGSLDLEKLKTRHVRCRMRRVEGHSDSACAELRLAKKLYL